MRWIQKDKNKIKRGDTDIPEGDAFFVDEKGSKAIVNGVLYIDGLIAPDGSHEIVVGTKKKVVTIKNGKIPVDVPKGGVKR